MQQRYIFFLLFFSTIYPKKKKNKYTDKQDISYSMKLVIKYFYDYIQNLNISNNEWNLEFETRSRKIDAKKKET